MTPGNNGFILIDMCGIVGYVGWRQAQPVLLDCLSKLEYRGYDSCGIAVCSNQLQIFKDALRVAALKKIAPSINGNIGIGHTRWATHGQVNAVNAHPHYDCSKKIAVVHNGIIDNFQELRQMLNRQGHIFVSDTDTEVIPHLIESCYGNNLLEAVEKALTKVEGSYAIAVLKEGDDTLIVSRKDSPLVIGIGDGEKYIASDIPAIMDYVNKVIYLEDGDIAAISRNNITILNNRQIVYREPASVQWNKCESGKGGYDHFMLKEIHEQPGIIRESLAGYPSEDYDYCTQIAFNSDFANILVLACGSSYHAGLLGKYLIEEFLGCPVRVELGSEFIQRSRLLKPSTVIAITQSGETADILIPLKKFKQAQVKIVAITNVFGSTASRLADTVIYTRAGPEVSVAATKTFIAQLIELYKLVLSSPCIDLTIRRNLIGELQQLPSRVQQVLDNDSYIVDCARSLTDYQHVFFIGRGINYPVALEGSLKLKEISYIHAEGYAAGELKHGPFALLDQNTPVVALAPRDDCYAHMISSIKEIKARHSPVIVLADETDDSITSFADLIIKIPHVSDVFTPVVNTVVLQLLAYYTARFRGCSIDYPRNLAKSVTVK